MQIASQRYSDFYDCIQYQIRMIRESIVHDSTKGQDDLQSSTNQKYSLPQATDPRNCSKRVFPHTPKGQRVIYHQITPGITPEDLKSQWLSLEQSMEPKSLPKIDIHLNSLVYIVITSKRLQFLLVQMICPVCVHNTGDS